VRFSISRSLAAPITIFNSASLNVSLIGGRGRRGCSRGLMKRVMVAAQTDAARCRAPALADPAARRRRWSGKPFTRKEFARQFAEARDAIPELSGLTLHGLRATAVINLRRAGLSYAQIGDIVGMSAKMVEHYCRNADMRSNSRAALTHLERAMARPAGVKAYNHVAMTRTNPEKARNGAN
jgi:DNA-binding CsgD family transcriptional regulator